MTSAWRWAAVLLRVTLVAALAAWMLRGFDLEAALGQLHRGQLLAVVGVQPLMVLVYVVLGWRFAELAAPPALRLSVATRAMALSAGLNYLLPARTSEFVKALYLRRGGAHRGGALMAAVVIERLMDLCIVATLTTLVVAARMAASSSVAIAAAIGAALCLWLSPHMARLALRVLEHGRWARATAVLKDFAERIAVLSRVHFDYRIWAAGALAWAISWVTVHVAMSVTLAAPVSWSASGLVFVASTLGFGVPLLPGGIGTVEVAAVAAQRMLGVELEAAVLVAAVMRLQQLIVPLMWSALILLREDDLWRRIRQPGQFDLGDDVPLR